MIPIGAKVMKNAVEANKYSDWERAYNGKWEGVVTDHSYDSYHDVRWTNGKESGILLDKHLTRIDVVTLQDL